MAFFFGKKIIFRKSKPLKKKGFTLVELLVSITIFAVVTTMVLLKHSQFNNNILLTNIGYEIALAIRRAQTYGLNVRELTTIASGRFNIGYGIHFRKTRPDGSSGDGSFVFFADIPTTLGDLRTANKFFEVNRNEQITEFELRKSFGIIDFCVTPVTGAELCAGANAIDRLDISFVRPNPDASIFATLSPSAGLFYESARIAIVAREDTSKVKNVVVTKTGQISIR